MHENGITPDQISSDTDNEKLSTLGLSEADGNKMYDAFGECDVDVQRRVRQEHRQQHSEVSEDCINDALSDDLLRRLFVTSVTKGEAGLDADEALTNDIFAALGKCAPTTTTS